MEDEIDRVALEMISNNLHESRIMAQLIEKKKEYEDVKIEFEKKKSKAEEEQNSLKFKENQLSTLKSNLKEEQDKLEITNKKNNEIIEEIVNIYKQSMLVKESLGDEQIRNQLLTNRLEQEKQIK